MHSSISGIIPIYGNSFVAASHSFWPKVHLRGFALVNHPVIFTIWRAPLPLSKGFSVIYYLWSLTDCLHIGVFSSLLPWEAREVLGSKIYGHFVKTLIIKHCIGFDIYYHRSCLHNYFMIVREQGPLTILKLKYVLVFHVLSFFAPPCTSVLVFHVIDEKSMPPPHTFAK